MRTIALALPLLVLPALADAEEVWRWHDEHGSLHYTNVAQHAPAGAAVVATPITLEVDRLPGAAPGPDLMIDDGQVVDVRGRSAAARKAYDPAALPPRFKPLPDPPRIYDHARLDFGCFTAGILYYGGFSHSEDISPVLNCYVYRLGPEAWLNAARAELAMRENGINPRDMLQLYLNQRP